MAQLAIMASYDLVSWVCERLFEQGRQGCTHSLAMGSQGGFNHNCGGDKEATSRDSSHQMTCPYGKHYQRPHD